MTTKTAITVAYGDGIGPEITKATLLMLEKAGAQLDIETIEVGKAVYERGVTSGIDGDAWDSLKSLNVTIRKSLGLFSNVRPCISYAPFIETKHPKMDMVVVRENEEDLYAGIEHRQTNDVVQCLKLISRPGCEKIVRYAFEYAKQNNRKKVTCMTKDNIMKLSDGLFHDVFNEIGKEYPEIEQDHMIIDIGTAMVADQPERFDVLVTTNLYGDIISDVAAQITGSVGLAGSSNIGSDFAMFEAIHGSAPDISGQNKANPSGMLLGAVMMLVHIGQPKVAEKLHNAWLKTIEDGQHTPDIYREGVSQNKLGTQEFAQAVIDRLGQLPTQLQPISYADNEGGGMKIPHYVPKPSGEKSLVGVDVFLDWKKGSPTDLAEQLKKASTQALEISVISNRGIKVWPGGQDETFCSDHWRCRFLPSNGQEECKHEDIIELLTKIANESLDFIKIENLCNFNGMKGYSLDQGQ